MFLMQSMRYSCKSPVIPSKFLQARMMTSWGCDSSHSEISVRVSWGYQRTHDDIHSAPPPTPPSLVFTPTSTNAVV